MTGVSREDDGKELSGRENGTCRGLGGENWLEARTTETAQKEKDHSTGLEVKTGGRPSWRSGELGNYLRPEECGLSQKTLRKRFVFSSRP